MGCSVECGKFLERELKKNKKIQIVTTIKIIKRKDKRQWDI